MVLGRQADWTQPPQQIEETVALISDAPQLTSQILLSLLMLVLMRYVNTILAGCYLRMYACMAHNSHGGPGYEVRHIRNYAKM